MPEIEKNFRKLMIKIGIAMLVFVAAFEVLVMVSLTVDEILAVTLEDQVIKNTVSQLFYGLMYATAFTVSAILLAQMTKKDKQPLIKKVALPKETVLYIFVGIAAVLSFAYINDLILSPFNSGDVIIDDSWKESYNEPYKVILQLITTAVAPGIFEELMFRGVMLAKLRPYGKTPAILISALMFSLMHQNAAQFLYAFAAGIVLGWVATETGSLLCCMLIHFSNNALSVLTQAAQVNMSYEIHSIVFYSLDFLIILFGAVSLIILAYSYYKKKKKRENDFSAGMFGRELVLQTDGGDFAIPAKKAVKLFFAPSVIVFICIAMVQVALILILTALGFSLI